MKVPAPTYLAVPFLWHHMLDNPEEIVHERLRKLRAVLGEDPLELLRHGMFLRQIDDELRQIFVVHRVVVVQLGAHFRDEGEMLQTTKLVHFNSIVTSETFIHRCVHYLFYMQSSVKYVGPEVS